LSTEISLAGTGENDQDVSPDLNIMALGEANFAARLDESDPRADCGVTVISSCAQTNEATYRVG
jgi:hypothetical protein